MELDAACRQRLSGNILQSNRRGGWDIELLRRPIIGAQRSRIDFGGGAVLHEG